MTPGKKHGTFQISTDFHEAVETYRQQHGLRSWSAALLNLAAIGYQVETGSAPPKAADPWGGDRRSADRGELTDARIKRLIGDDMHNGE